ncbi:hypothetical protein [Streptomyces sp. NPDC005336]|uniref:hypothetical protein n=1 Tax=unclassified Streptomyces TaxID=2593676 RepID=UPI0033B9B53F
MNTHTRTKAGLAALLTATALALTACGSDSKSGDDKEIDGAKKATKSASPSASPSDDGIQRPKITLPSDDNLVFEGQQTGDPKKDAVLKDNAERLRAVDEAIGKRDPQSDAVAFYSTGDARAAAADWINGLIKDGVTVTGTVRYYNRKVTFLKDGSAALTYCGDESKGYTKNFKTQKVNVTPATKKSYVFYNERLEKDKHGVWQSTKGLSERGFEACQP